MTVRQNDDRLARQVDSEKQPHEAKRNAAEWMWYTFLKEKKKQRARASIARHDIPVISTRVYNLLPLHVSSSSSPTVPWSSHQSRSTAYSMTIQSPPSTIDVNFLFPL